jgi:uncharacterized protein with GYD domain
MVLGAFDAIVTIEGEDDQAIAKVVTDISRTRGVKEAKPLIEIPASSRRQVKPIIGHRI